MHKNRAQSIVIHGGINTRVLPDKINELYVQVIERKLNQCNLTAQQKINVIDDMIRSLPLREFDELLK